MITVWVIKELVYTVNFTVISKQSLFLTMEHNGLIESGSMKIIHNISLHQYIYNTYMYIPKQWIVKNKVFFNNKKKIIYCF